MLWGFSDLCIRLENLSLNKIYRNLTKQCSRRLQLRALLTLCHRIAFGAANCQPNRAVRNPVSCPESEVLAILKPYELSGPGKETRKFYFLRQEYTFTKKAKQNFYKIFIIKHTTPAGMCPFYRFTRYQRTETATGSTRIPVPLLLIGKPDPAVFY
jgi:hypothetical protein